MQKCSFQHSLAPAIRHKRTYLSIIIIHCSFINNNLYRGHGVAVYYQIDFEATNFIIKNCSFHNNGSANSIVYINKYTKENTNYGKPLIYIESSNFQNNQGVAVYLSFYIKLYFKGEIIHLVTM